MNWTEIRKKINRKYVLVGIALIIFSLLFSPIFSWLYKFGYYLNDLVNNKKFIFDYLAVKSLQTILVIIGSMLIVMSFRKSNDEIKSIIKKIAQNLLLLLITIILFLFIFEMVLRTGILDQKDSAHPIWVPVKYKELNKQIMEKNHANQRKNDFLDDCFCQYPKKPGAYRVAIIGDSFIVGDKMPSGLTWKQRLEDIYKDSKGKIDFISWGQNGATTLTQFEYLKEKGIKFKPDMAIVGFVTNDPDMNGSYFQIHYMYLNMTKVMKPLRFLFPNAVDFIGEYIAGVGVRYSDKIGYFNWEKQLYTEENLKKYGELLQEFSKYCHDNNIKLIFVLTPNTYEDYFADRYKQIIPLLEKAKIEYVNTYPAMKEKLGKYKVRELWANPADGHPGDLVHELYTEEINNYLKKHYPKIFNK